MNESGNALLENGRVHGSESPQHGPNRWSLHDVIPVRVCHMHNVSGSQKIYDKQGGHYDTYPCCVQKLRM